MYGHPRVVEALLADERTDPRLRTKYCYKSKTAAEEARERGRIGIAEAIEAKIMEKNEWSLFRAAFIGGIARAQATQNGFVFGVPSPETRAGGPAGGGSAGAADATKPRSSTPGDHFGMD
jgi:hypothetical protein